VERRVFNHSAETTFEAIGIEEKRFHEIKAEVLVKFMTNGWRISEVYEWLYELADKVSLIELLVYAVNCGRVMMMDSLMRRSL